MRIGSIAGLILAAALAAAPAVALAQEVAAPADAAAATPPSSPDDATEAAADTPLSDEESAALGQALLFDPAAAIKAKPVKPLRLPSLYKPQALDINSTDKPDGSSTVVVKQPLPIEWDAKVGADLGLSPSAQDSYQPGRPQPASRDGRGSGAAWASVGVLPNFATVDARVDPGNDQGKLGTTFKHSIPVGGKFSVTLQNSYSVTETFGAPPATPGDLPLMAPPPAPGATPAATAPQVWDTEKLAKLNILPTGTTFGAKLASASTDPVTHNTLSAEQKLYGPLHVTTAVTDVGQPTVSKSITAGFKLNW